MLAAVIAAGFLLTGAGTALMERSRARRNLQQQALTFTALSTGPIAIAYNGFFKTGFYKFREEVLERKRLNPSLERIQIVDVAGQLRYDSTRMETAGAPLPTNPVFSAATLAAVVGQDKGVLVGGTRAADLQFQVVDPYLEEWGKHELSVVYSFDIRRPLDHETRHLAALWALVLGGAAATITVVLVLLRRVG